MSHYITIQNIWMEAELMSTLLVDMLYSYQALGPNLSQCRLVIMQCAEYVAVVFIDDDVTAYGTSITNWSENLATAVKQGFLPEVDPDHIRFFEYYAHGLSGPSDFCAVQYTRRCRQYHDPVWQSVPIPDCLVPFLIERSSHE